MYIVVLKLEIEFFESFLCGNNFYNIVCCLLAGLPKQIHEISTFVRRATYYAHLQMRNANRMNDDKIKFVESLKLNVLKGSREMVGV